MDQHPAPMTDAEWAKHALHFWLHRIVERVRAEWIRRALELGL